MLSLFNNQNKKPYSYSAGYSLIYFKGGSPMLAVFNQSKQVPTKKPNSFLQGFECKTKQSKADLKSKI